MQRMVQQQMVVVRLQGGLGNQLFEYAAGLHLARKRNATLRLRHADEPGISLFDIFPDARSLQAPPTLTRRFVAPGPGTPASAFAKHLIGRVPGYRRWYGVLRQSGVEVPRVEQASGRHVLLVGWFIAPQWYSSVLPDVAGQLLARLQDHPNLALASEATVVSFRRGDFVRWGWALDTAYYERALAVLDAHGPSTGPFYVVGDDDMFLDFAVDWLRARGRNASRPPRASGSAALADLALLAGANRVIASNSTFCWWGLAAGDAAGRAGRAVVVPDPWVPNGAGTGVLQDNEAWHRVPSAFTAGPG